MSGGSESQKSRTRIVEPTAMLSAPSIHPAATDADEVGAMASAFEYATSLDAKENLALTARGRTVETSAREPIDTSGPTGRPLRGVWPVFLAGLPALVTLVALSLRLFPWLEPTPPPDVRNVAITDLVFGERNRDLGDGVVANVVFFEVEVVGYNADDPTDDIAVDWLEFDAQTRQRLEEHMLPERWGVIVFGTRSDRVVGQIIIPPPANHVGCMFVRVQLQPFATASAGESSEGNLMLDIADTAPFDPFDPTNPDCPDELLPSALPA